MTAVGERVLTGEKMTAQGSLPPRKLFDVELPAKVAELLRKVEYRANRQEVVALRGPNADLGPAVSYYDDAMRPTIVVPEKSGPPPVEALALEVARLWLRGTKLDKYMPYTEMRHPANQRLCRRLYRIMEEEVILSECSALGVATRKWLQEKLDATFTKPLIAGKYRNGEPDPGRLREGALDALEATIAEIDEKAQKRYCMTVAEADAGIARAHGLMSKVVEHNRPFDSEDRIRAAYYLAVPFLFDARKPASPIFKTS